MLFLAWCTSAQIYHLDRPGTSLLGNELATPLVGCIPVRTFCVQMSHIAFSPGDDNQLSCQSSHLAVGEQHGQEQPQCLLVGAKWPVLTGRTVKVSGVHKLSKPQPFTLDETLHSLLSPLP